MIYRALDTRYDTMPYRRTGRSGLLLPAVSLGIWYNFGGVDVLENSGNEDMDKMFHDMLPFMALTTPLALAYGDGGSFPSIDQITNLEGNINSGLSFLQNFARDVIFMEMASDGYVVGKQQGGWEK